MKSKLLVLPLLLVLSACSTYTVEPEPLPANLTVRCSEVLPSDYGFTGKEWLRMAKEWSTQYKECAVRHNGLVEALEARESYEVKRWIWQN